MKKRDRKKDNREILRALAMITQIGLSMMTCMGVSFAIGYFIDQRCGTKFWVMIMLLIGIMASIRSLFILTGRISFTEESQNNKSEGDSDEGSNKDTP